jgi:hypothetical protein
MDATVITTPLARYGGKIRRCRSAKATSQWFTRSPIELAVQKIAKKYRITPASPRTHRRSQAGESPAITFAQSPLFNTAEVTSQGPTLRRCNHAQGGFEASFGTYEIDERAHAFTYHVEGALVRTLIGQDLTRVYDFSGKQLIVKSSSPDEHWRVAWEHD